jgi:hypothetical protein
MTGRKQWQCYLLIAFTTLVTYWPLTLGVFSLKNDAFIYFLPWRYHISESIQHGFFPFWSPYLYTGLPLYCDMQSGSWNPVVLGISLFTRYNMFILQWELLLYIFIAGIGMFRLVSEFNYSAKTALVAAIAYLCCGFITDSGSFIPWITCAAYLPFLFLYFYRVLTRPGLANTLKLSLVLFLLITAGYPSYLIYAIYLLAAGFIYWFIGSIKRRSGTIKSIKYLLFAGGIFILLAAPVLLSFIDFLPYYTRGQGATLQQSLTDPFNLFCSISYLFPSAVAKSHEWIHTDVAMRNGYVGIYTIAFFTVALLLPYNPVKKFLLGITLFSFVFSLGELTPLRGWCYRFLPLMNSFRHPAIIRLFTSIGIILLSAQAVDYFFKQDNVRIPKMVRRVLVILALVVLAFMAYYYFREASLKDHFITNKGVKAFIDNCNLPVLIILLGIIQVAFIVAFLLVNKRKNIAFPVMIGNTIFFAVIALPFSFVSQTPTKDIDRYLSSFPAGYPPPDLSTPVLPVNDKTFGTGYTDYDKFYNKKISIQKDIITPTVNRAYYSFLEDRSLVSSAQNKPFAFITGAGMEEDSTSQLTIKSFTPSHFSFIVKASRAGYINVFQQYNKHWIWKLNNVPVNSETAYKAFMKVKIPNQGIFEADLNYSPGIAVILLMYISAVAFFSLVVLLILKQIKFSVLNPNE